MGWSGGENELAELPGRTAAHAQVQEAVHEDREILHVRAPGLHPEDVRRVVAAAFADLIPDDWEQRFS